MLKLKLQYFGHLMQQGYHFAAKGLSSQSYGFSSIHVWMWELAHKTECQRTDAFELWDQRRLLRIPWTAKRSNQSILKISPEYSLEGLILMLKLQYFGHLMRRANSLGNTLMLGKVEGRRRRRWQRKQNLKQEVTNSGQEYIHPNTQLHLGHRCPDPAYHLINLIPEKELEASKNNS